MNRQPKNSSDLHDLENIRSYVEGKMDPKQRFEFENAMLEDPLLMDAVEGFQKKPDWQGAKDIQFRIDSRFGLSGKLWYALGIVAVFGLILLWVLVDEDRVSTNQITSEEKMSIPKEEIEKTPFDEADTELNILSTENTDSSVSLTVDSKIDVPANDTYLNIRRVESPLPMESLNPEKVLASEDAQNKTPERSHGGRIYHIMDYKVADYRGLRTGLDPENIISGTPANEEIEVAVDPDRRQKLKIPYVDYLEESMRYFALGKYTEALSNFRYILKTYPEDVNAQFYGGMSAYQLGLYAMATTLFQKAEKNIIPTFIEESRFYRSMCYLDTGKKLEAEQLLRNIVEEEGFYSERAKAIVKGL